jgi:hypothetical protein
MTRLTKYILTVAAAALMSSSAFAAIDFTDDFEGYTEFTGTDISPLGGGWTAFATVFSDYPGCSNFIYNYNNGSPFPAPNKAGGFSNIVAGGDTGQALNIFSDYDNRGAQLAPDCIQTSVFQETVFAAADAGMYTFQFRTEVPGPLGSDVNTFGFVKLLDPNNGYIDVLGGLTVDTATAGVKSITVDLDATADGKILQWGFSTKSSNDDASGRWYDDVSFALEGVYQPPTGPSSVKYEGIPIPYWALLIMAGLFVYLGGKKLRARKET